jgi:cob(I)alamin adenosyltransferase
MKIYTRTGDDGTTALFSGERVPKDHPRVKAYGAVDELNSELGFRPFFLKLVPIWPLLMARERCRAWILRILSGWKRTSTPWIPTFPG